MPADRTFPALEIRFPPGAGADDAFGWLLAALDDAHPTSADDLDHGARVFFATAADRDRAAAILAGASDHRWTCSAVDVPDEHWAERSQASLGAVVVGRLTIAPPWTDAARVADSHTIVVQPSMGFGTGHHASTRLCLSLLQEIDVAGARVIDVGTGSGVLAIAATRLGAREVLAVDVDPDAIASADENLDLNQARDRVTVRQLDLGREPPAGAPFDLVLANLTGAMLVREAARLSALLAPGGAAILSGIESHEGAEVVRAFQSVPLAVASRLEQDGWVGLLLVDAAAPGQAVSRAV